MNCDSIKTKFGIAKISMYGYYHIISRKEGNYHKLLHRLIFEDFYNIVLPTDIQIHHEDGNKLNNKIWNLIPMTKSEHMSLHRKKGLSLYHKMMMSKSLNKTGYFRVHKLKNKEYKQGFVYVYQYFDESHKRKRIVRKNINELKEAVLSKGLEWINFEVDLEL